MGYRFNHLMIPETWQQYWSKYPDGYTILEALINWVSQVDKMVDNVNDWNERLDEFVKTFDSELQETIRNILTEWQNSGFLKVIIGEALQTEIDTKLDSETFYNILKLLNDRIEALTSGFSEGAFATLADLEAKYPNGKGGMFVVQDTGNWYFWVNGSGWTVGGKFGEAGIADGTVTLRTLDRIMTELVVNTVKGKRTRNLFNKDTAISNFYVQWHTGNLLIPTDGNTYYASWFIDVVEGQDINIHRMNQVAFYGSDYSYKDGIDNSSNLFYTFKVPTGKGITKMRVTTLKEYLDEQQVELGQKPTHYVPYILEDDSQLSYIPLQGEKTKNLIVKSEVIQDKYVRWDNGTFGTNTNYVMSIMEVEELTNYYANFGDQFAFVDINKNYVDGKNTNTNPNAGTLLFTPARTRFIIASIPKDKLDMAQIEKGSSTTSYVQGGIKLKDGYILESSQQAKPFKRVKDIMIDFLYDPDKTQEVVFLGDSKTHGVGGTGWKQDGEQIGNTPYKTSPNSYCWANEMCHLITQKSGKKARNWGTTGQTSKFIRDNLSSLIRATDKIVFLSILTNDRNASNNSSQEQAFDNLVYIGNYVRSLGKEIIFVSPSPVSIANETDTSNVKNYHQEDVDNINARAARYFNMDYISIYKGMLNYCEYRNITIDSLLADGIHENDAGYKVDFHIVADESGISRKRDGATW